MPYPPNYPISPGVKINIPLTKESLASGSMELWWLVNSKGLYDNRETGLVITSGVKPAAAPVNFATNATTHNVLVSYDTAGLILSITLGNILLVPGNPISTGYAWEIFLREGAQLRLWLSDAETVCDVTKAPPKNLVAKRYSVNQVKLNWVKATVQPNAYVIWKEYPAFSGWWSRVVEVSYTENSVIVNESQFNPLPRYGILAVGGTQSVLVCTDTDIRYGNLRDYRVRR